MLQSVRNMKGGSVEAVARAVCLKTRFRLRGQRRPGKAGMVIPLLFLTQGHECYLPEPVPGPGTWSPWEELGSVYVRAAVTDR